MNMLGVSLIVSSVILFSVLVVDDAFGIFIESRDTIKISQTNEYANYVHFQPEWKSYPRNLIIDVTTTWEREVVPGEEEQSDITKYGAKQRQNGLQYVNNKPVVAVQYDYRDCESQWIHYAKTGIDFIRYNLNFFEGNTSIPNSAYSDESQKQKLQNGFAQFVPICTSKESTNYEYVVSVNDDAIGFDVYFVPSYVQQWYYFLYPENFEYYSNDGCFANNFQKFSGTCSGVDKNSGLLIVVPDELSRPLTKISVKLTET